MTTVVLPIASAPLSAYEALRMAGIPILPSDRVRAHKAAELAKRRQGFWGKYWMIPRAGAAIERASPDLAFFLILLVSFMIAVWSGRFIEIGGLCFVAFTCLWIAATYTVRILGVMNWDFADATSRWERLSFDTEAKRIPRHLLRRATLAREVLRNTGLKPRLSVEAFKDDPFLIIKTREGLRTSTFYIGAWGTGKPELDNA